MAKDGLKPMASLRYKTTNDFRNSNLNIDRFSEQFGFNQTENNMTK